MPVSLSTLIDRSRRFVRDWPAEDILTASVASNGATLTVADGLLYADNWLVEIDQEVLFVNGNGSGTSVTVRRGMRGSTAASHASNAAVLLRPHFFAVEYIDALNNAKDDAYPLIYKPVLDTSLTTLADTYEYTVPNMPGTFGGDTIRIPYVSKLEIKYSGENDYRELRNYSIRRGATPKLQFDGEPESGATLRVHGYGPFPDLVFGDSLDTQWPKQAERILPVGAAGLLLASGEAGRVRVDTGVQDAREQSNRTGSSMAASNALYNRFLRMLAQAALPPMPPHVKPTF